MRFCLFAALCVSLLPITSRAEVWPQEVSDLKPDSKAVFGRLENGLRYIIYPNKFPVAGRASVRLYMDAGSLMEEDDQQGMAHFLEHMAFNGSKRFAAGTMVERFQRLGMGFGADTNAHTSFKETVYKLELPRVDEKMFTEAFDLFRDDLDGMLLGQEEIDKERGVILSEKLARDSVDTRTMEAGYKFSLPESLIPFRMPIGVEETLNKMARPRFADFYEKWYTPKRAVVVVVGDVDIPLVEGLIKKNFSDAKARRGESEDPSFGKVTKGRGLQAMLHTEMEAAATEISIEVPREASRANDSAGKRREKMIRTLADNMLNQRLSELAKAENSPILEGQAYNFDMFKFVESNGIYAKSKPEQWQAALSLAEQELRRAVQHGFTEAEFAEATSSFLKGVRLRAEQKDTRKNSDLADGFVRQLGSEQVITDPDADLKRVTADLAGIKAEDCHKSLQEVWKNPDVQVFIGGNLKLENAPETILAAFRESQKQEVKAPEQAKALEFAYTNFGEAGKIASRKEVKDLEITQAVFGNEVRANVKKTDFEKNGVRIMVTFGGGKLEVPKDKPGMIPFAQSVFPLAGLEKHSVDDLRRIFASKTVSTEFAINDDSFVLSGRTTPQDFEAQCQRLAANLVAPGWRDEAERQFKKNLDALYTAIDHTDEGVMQDKVEAFIRSGDARFGYPDRKVMDERSLAELKAWLTPALQNGYMEVSVVGDIDPDKALEVISKTFGALPKRQDKKPEFADARKIAFPKDVHNKDFSFVSEITRSWALAYWPTADMMDIKRTRRLILLGQILDDRLRLKIREELGETYSPMAHHLANDTFTDYGYMFAAATLKPDQVEKVKPMFKEIGANIEKGITADEFERAREPMLQQLIQTRRDNRYWLARTLMNCQAQPYRLDWSRSLMDDFSSIKKEDLEALAKQYLGEGQVLTVGLVPATKQIEARSE
ncbi:M16 family metallopeptidase [Roseimicrobium sp. ORNL1]|uniref:M16 family metallopeptidase n=1 Tax=Roseimicrobium sp. ORNL1 TaxID=2711231 RepID=UPI0013E1A629|nr:M16 family metallopeptidase [Roseimicrobium sp. ORNL1]QIF00941.1 insulinase family protein [Roseimicrobium sp. ORNL1]